MMNEMTDILSQQAREAFKLVESASASYDAVYVVNMLDDSFKILHDDAHARGNEHARETFSQEKAAFLANIVHPCDRERMGRELDFGAIREKLANRSSYEEEYRVLIEGETILCEMAVTALGDDEVALGFVKKDVELTKYHLEEKRYDEYYALFVVDLYTEQLKVVKTTPWYRTGAVGDVAPYSMVVQAFASVLPDEPKAYFMQRSDIEFVKRELAVEDKHTYSYKSTLIEGGRWIEVTSYVILRNADGSPAMFTLGFSLVDSQSADRRELRRQLDEVMRAREQRHEAFISGFIKDYEAVYLCDLTDGTARNLSAKVGSMQQIAETATTLAAFRKNAEEFVHPLDLPLFIENVTDVDKIKAKLAVGDGTSIEYRTSIAGEFVWQRATINRVDEEELLLGFEACDEEVIRRIASETLLDEYDAVYLVEPDKNEVRAARPSRVSSVEVSSERTAYDQVCRKFAETAAPQYKQDWVAFSDPAYLKRYMAEEDHREYVYELPGTERAMRRFSIDVIERTNGEATTLLFSFMGIDQSRAQTLLLQKQVAEQSAFTEFFLEPYESAYYVGLDSLSCQVYKRMARLDEEYPIVTNYLDSLEAYIDREVHPGDRAKFKELIRPQKMKELLAAQPEFSFVFRTMRDGVERTSRFQAIRGADESHAAFGFMDITEEDRQRNEIERLQAREQELMHAEFRASAVAYLTEHEGDVTAFLEFFAERLRELVKCDQVIYRDENGHRFINNAPALGDAYEIAAETCENCPHSDMHSPLYASGVTEMEDTSIGVDGVPVNKNCPVKSALTRTVHLDGDVCGYLAIHYILGPHEFSDYERQTLEEFTNLLSLSLSRHAAKVRNAENNARVMANFAGNVSSFLLNVDTGGFRPYHQNEDLSVYYEEDQDFDAQFSPSIDSAIYEPDRQMVREKISLPAFRAFLKSGESEYRVVFRDISTGSHRWYEMRATKFSDNQVVVGFSDINDKQIEHLVFEKMEDDYYALIYAYLDSGIAYAIKDGPGVLVKEGESALYSDVIGKLVQMADGATKEFYKKQADIEYLNRKFETEDKASFVYRSVRADEDRWVNMTQLVLERDEQGKPLVLAMEFSILDEEAQAAQALQETIAEQQVQLEAALSMAEAANRAKTTFLNNMSHDIRTPMNAIIGYTRLAAKHFDDTEKVQDYLGKIEQSSSHLLSLINDVLDMSRIESGKMNLDEKPENLCDIVCALGDIVQADVHAKQLELSVDATGVIDEDVICDRLRLNQVLLNILSNSIKYTAEGGAVSLSVRETAAKPSGYATYEFRVRDNGMGMTPEFLEHIFDPFERVKSSTVSGIQGTGLGMAITKSLVDMMGGHIAVESELGKGTEMTVTFDFKLQDARKEAASAEAGRGAMEHVALDLSGKRVLLVEDNELNREIAQEILEEYGVEVDTAEDGQIAVEILRRLAEEGDFWRYDLVLMDIQMPVMDGYEATRLIRATPGTETFHLPIIAMTANAFEEDRRAALEAGMDEHIAKPIDVEKLKETLAKFM